MPKILLLFDFLLKLKKCVILSIGDPYYESVSLVCSELIKYKCKSADLLYGPVVVTYE